MEGTKVYYRLHKKGQHTTDAGHDRFTFTPNVTHVQVGLCNADWSNDEIFEYYNVGEGLTSKGAQAKIKETKDLEHTSMSVGDVVVTKDNKAYVCDNFGWRELTRVNQNYYEVWA